MARVIHLGGWFLTGCIASSFVSWLGAIHPALWRVMLIIYGFVAVLLGIAVICDDAVRVFIRLSPQDYYAVLIACGTAVLIGGVLSWIAK